MKMACYFIPLLIGCFSTNAEAQVPNKAQPGKVKIIFSNCIQHQPLVLYDSSYTTPFGEIYTINKLKYYLCNFTLFAGGKAFTEKNKYHLINQEIDNSLSFFVTQPENNYDSIGFLLGVDSAKNTSGAQTGALDPVNDMFWTWRSGYIMEKIEGSSPQSSAINNKMEYHLGGFEGPYSVLKFITLSFPKEKKLVVKKNKKNTIFIEADIDKFWNTNSGLKISETPVCSLPGAMAQKIAANFYQVFSVTDIIN